MKNKNTLSTNLHIHRGQIRHTFYSPEFLEYIRGPLWYFVAAIIGIGIITLGLVTKSITLTLAFVLFVAVYWLLHEREPRLLEISITQNGVRIENDFVSFNEIEEFWLTYNPPFVANLKLKVRRKWQSVLTIHIFGQNPEALRKLLSPHVKEAEREEELTDLIVRALRL